jgi:hypothetical protein
MHRARCDGADSGPSRVCHHAAERQRDYVSWSYFDGGLDFNGAIPVTGATGTYSVPVISYYRSFSLLGRSANFVGFLPYGIGTFQGAVLGTQRQVYRSGLLDVGLRFSVNLKGGPAMKTPEFLHILAKELAQVKLPEEQVLSVFLRESSQLWDALVSAGKSYRRPMAPSTAHQLMESFNLLLPFDPPGILRRVARLITGRTFGYHFDELAIGEFVKFAEKLLADHKETLRDPANAVYFGEVLDVFVSAGWPAATQIVTRLDSAVR